MIYDEQYGTMPLSTLDILKVNNVSPADWDDMLARWDIDWFDEDKPWKEIENHVVAHSSFFGFYHYPMYEG